MKNQGHTNVEEITVQGDIIAIVNLLKDIDQETNLEIEILKEIGINEKKKEDQDQVIEQVVNATKKRKKVKADIILVLVIKEGITTIELLLRKNSIVLDIKMKIVFRLNKKRMKKKVIRSMSLYQATKLQQSRM